MGQSVGEDEILETRIKEKKDNEKFVKWCWFESSSKGLRPASLPLVPSPIGYIQHHEKCTTLSKMSSPPPSTTIRHTHICWERWGIFVIVICCISSFPCRLGYSNLPMYMGIQLHSRVVGYLSQYKKKCGYDDDEIEIEREEGGGKEHEV